MTSTRPRTIRHVVRTPLTPEIALRRTRSAARRRIQAMLLLAFRRIGAPVHCATRATSRVATSSREQDRLDDWLPGHAMKLCSLIRGHGANVFVLNAAEWFESSCKRARDRIQEARMYRDTELMNQMRRSAYTDVQGTLSFLHGEWCLFNGE